MLGVGGHGKQPHEFVMVEDLGQGGRRLGARQIDVRVGQTERAAVQEADAVTNAVAALPGQPLLFVQMDEIVLGLPGRRSGRGCGGSRRASPVTEWRQDFLVFSASPRTVMSLIMRWRSGVMGRLHPRSDRSRRHTVCAG